MRKFIGTQPWLYGLLYLGLSLAVEIVLLVVGRLHIPQDNHLIAPIVLTIPPLLASWLAGMRWPRPFLMLFALTAGLTLLLTAIAGRLTGISTGLLLPIIVRFTAGLLAATIAFRLNAEPKKP